MKYRIGNSIDFHNLEFQKNNIITLGSLRINSNYKIIAESDGDIVLHAICNAILGALCKKDIGEYFNKTDMEKNNSSLQIVNYCLKLLSIAGMKIVNVDLTIICEHILIKGIRAEMKKRLSSIFKCQEINVKATRWENMQDYRICCMCSILLYKEKDVSKN